jgi:hypothetical protein
VAATADPATPPAKATWYLVTNLPRPGGPREPDSPHPAAGLAEITRIYGIRHWIEQSYKQIKDEVGWADSQVRSDTAIRRHQALVNCAFSFCWAAWFADTPPQQNPAPPRPAPSRGERGATRRLTPAGAVLAAGAARHTCLAHPLDRAATLVAGTVKSAPAAAAPSPDELGRGRLRPAPLHPELTNYRQANGQEEHELQAHDRRSSRAGRRRATLLVRAVDGILGTHRPWLSGRVSQQSGMRGDRHGRKRWRGRRSICLAGLRNYRRRERGTEPNLRLIL